MYVAPDPRSHPGKDALPITSVEAEAHGSCLFRATRWLNCRMKMGTQARCVQKSAFNTLSHLPIPVRAGTSQQFGGQNCCLRIQHRGGRRGTQGLEPGAYRPCRTRLLERSRRARRRFEGSCSLWLRHPILAVPTTDATEIQ